MRIGVDSGGTFTDFVVLTEEGRLTAFKLRSNPASPASVILEGIRRIEARHADVVHGSTVATNALLERKGAKTAFITTRGFEDLIAIGRQNRPELYNLTPPLPRPLVERGMCFGVDERVLFDGSVERPLKLGSIRAKVKGAEAVAICLLHSYANPAHERELMAALQGCGYVCASADVSPEFREFERASTTVINAYVGPLMDRYLGALERECPHPIAVMQSNGGLLTAAEARVNAVRTILSGPAGGIIGAVEIARRAGFDRALTFDMGGTSTDVALAGTEPRLTTEARLDGFPVRVPMLDIHTVGAGGGSIATVDAGGSLRVGPQSAGAVPGPACYGTGGREATVTDAHVVLGRITATHFAGGAVTIDAARAKEAVGRVGAKLGLSVRAAAGAIIRVANSNMERAIRAVSTERGEDPRDFPLVAFGGCGGLHACEIAQELGIKTVIVPKLAGALSALGMLLADRVRDYSGSSFAVMEKRARQDLRGAKLLRYADVRYVGQSYELTIPWGGDFHAEHQRVYGYSNPERPTETVTLRLRAVKAVSKPQTIRPEPLDDYGSTTFIPRGWAARTDSSSNLIIRSR